MLQLDGSKHAIGGSPIGGSFAHSTACQIFPDMTTVSHDTTMYASMFEQLNRPLETLITKPSKSTERGERSRRTLMKPKSYKKESDGCSDTWIEVMRWHFEEEKLSKKQECSVLTSNLEGTALNCVMAKRTN